jgi:hypothetical protein
VDSLSSLLSFIEGLVLPDTTIMHKYAFHLAPRAISRWGILTVFENRATRHLEIVKFLKKSNLFKRRLFQTLVPMHV